MNAPMKNGANKGNFLFLLLLPFIVLLGSMCVSMWEYKCIQWRVPPVFFCCGMGAFIEWDAGVFLYFFSGSFTSHIIMLTPLTKEFFLLEEEKQEKEKAYVNQHIPCV